MHHFFTKAAREIYHFPKADFMVLGAIGFFARNKLKEMREEKEALEKANPGMKITVKREPGGFRWALEEEKAGSPPNGTKLK